MKRAILVTLLCLPLLAINEPDFSLVLVPDPQYLAEQCPTAYNSLLTWVTNNQALSVGGESLNIKGIISVGDCLQTPTDATERTRTVTAWTILDTASFPYLTIAGNHDQANGYSFVRSVIGAHFDTGGYFAVASRAAQPYWSTALPGAGGFSYWGGGYDATGVNTYVRFLIGTRKILLIGLEFYPRTIVLNWAKGIADTYPDHEVIVSTHGYLNDMGEQVPRGTGTTHNVDGPDAYGLTSAPGSNSGVEMWDGSAASPGWAGFKTWDNLKMIVSGHWNYLSSDTNGLYPPWWWQQIPITSSSANAQTVQQVWYNEQELDNGGGWCPAGVPNGTSDAAHLMILRFRNRQNSLEAYALSVNSGKWIGGIGTTPAASPVRLFLVNYPPLVSDSGQSGATGQVTTTGQVTFR